MSYFIPEKAIRLPNLFIVGAAKSGTTSLWHLLKQHPSVFMPEDELYKEPGYLSDLYGIKDRDKYLSIFSKASHEKYVGEATNAYLTDPNSARRIYEFNPNSKIIIMLRHPVMRAYSLYNWMVQEGYEYARTFEAALLKEEKRKNKKIPNFFEPVYYHNYMYFRSGLYHSQIERYVNLFGHNVFIGLFEQFVENEFFLLKKITHFLNIDEDVILCNEKHKNSSQKVLSPVLSFMTRKAMGYFYKIAIKINFLDEHTSKTQRDFFLKYFTLNQKPESIKLDTYKYLLNLYQEEYKKLEHDFGLNLDYWKKIDKKQLS